MKIQALSPDIFLTISLHDLNMILRPNSYYFVMVKSFVIAIFFHVVLLLISVTSSVERKNKVVNAVKIKIQRTVAKKRNNMTRGVQKKESSISFKNFNFKGIHGRFSRAKGKLNGTQKNNLLAYLEQEIRKMEPSLSREKDSVFTAQIDLGGREKNEIISSEFVGHAMNNKLMQILRTIPAKILPSNRIRLKVIVSLRSIPAPQELAMFTTDNSVVFQVTKYGKGKGLVNNGVYYGAELLKFITNPLFYFL